MNSKSLTAKTSFRALLLVLFLAVLLNTISVSAANDHPTISVNSTNAASGDTVNVEISISDNPGILGATLEVSFDTRLTLVAAKSGSAFSALQMTKPGKFTSPCRFVWDGQELESDDIKDGTILTLTFTVPDTITEDADLPISLSYLSGGIVDENLQPVDITTENGSIQVKVEKSAVSITNAFIKDGSAQVTICADSSLENAKIYLAGYDENGRFTGINTKTVSLKNGFNIATVPFSDSCKNYKVFLLTDNYSPLADCHTIIEGQKSFSVKFVDWNGTTLSETNVYEGCDANPPENPVREGYIFTGWDKSFKNVTEDIIITAVYSVDSSPAFVVDSVTTQIGSQEIKVNISVRNNPGILGMTMKLTYDDSNLTLLKATNGDAVSGVLTLTKPKSLVSGCNFVWDGTEIEDSDIQDGTILSLIFKPVNNASAGTYPITVSYNNGAVVDNDLTPLDLQIINGKIVLTK